MKTLILIAVTFTLLTTIPFIASADFTMEITADSTLAGQSGSILTITEPGFPTESFFAFVELGKLRVFASRIAGSQMWTLSSGLQYLTPTTAMSVGDTWRFLDDDDTGAETVATAVALESVTVLAGTFTAFKVNIALASAPGILVESIWFATGVGIVKNVGFLSGVLDWKSELGSFTVVGGSGFFPTAIGNLWTQVEIPVAVEATSWATVKSLFN